MIDRTFNLDRGARNLTALFAHVSALDVTKRWRVVVGPARKDRSLEQNNALYGVAYKVLSDYTGHTGPELHEMFLRSYFGETEKTIMGKVIRTPRRSTTIDERGQRNVISTRDFMEFYRHIQQKAAEIGCDVPDPDPLWQEREDAA